MARAPSLIPPPPRPFRQPLDLARPRSTVGRSSFPTTCRKVSVQEMGGFPAVLPPHIALPAVAEPLPWNFLLLKAGAPETRNQPPIPKPVWRHLATSPCWRHHGDVIHHTRTHPSASCWRQHDVTAKKARRQKSRFWIPRSSFWGSFWCVISAHRCGK